MVGKKGFLRIVEAVIAILIIFGVLFVVSINNDIREDDLVEEINPLLDEISKNLSAREKIIEGNPEIDEEIRVFLSERITNPNLEFEVRICEAEEICGLGELPEEFRGEIFSDERVIGASLNSNEGDFDPKKLKIFIWQVK